jgi:hypothetical protein
MRRTLPYFWIILAVAWVAGSEAILQVEREIATLLSPPDPQAATPDAIIAAFASLLNGVRRARAVEAICTDAVIMLLPPAVIALVVLALAFRPRDNRQTAGEENRSTIKGIISSTSGSPQTGQTGRTLNISSTSTDWRGLALSNFGLSPFVLDGMLFASVEVSSKA